MARTISRRKKRFTIALTTVLVLGGAGTAFAYWTSTGTGEGSAETGTSAEFDITSADPDGTIAPDSAGQTVEFTVTMAGPTGVAWVPTGDCKGALHS